MQNYPNFKVGDAVISNCDFRRGEILTITSIDTKGYPVHYFCRRHHRASGEPEHYWFAEHELIRLCGYKNDQTYI
jgi:hypothetical protein